MRYLSDKVLKGFDAYKYSSKDTSPVANYVMHPFWNWLVEYFPRWVAPNLMTFIGFLMTSFNFFLIWWYDPFFTASNVTSTSKVPVNLWLLVAILNFVAHQLDGMDGKQARRTGTSTPLGELFDHGCDSWTSSLLPMTAISIFGNDIYGPTTWEAFMAIWTMLLCFLMSHWEKYLTGVLYLPWGYDIGQLGATFSFLATYIGTESIWKTTVNLPWFSFNVSSVAFLCVIVSVLFSVPMTVLNIIQSYRLKTGSMYSFWEATKPLIPISSLFIVSLVWACMSPNDVMKNYTRLFMYVVGIAASNSIVILIIAQMSNTRAPIYNSFVLCFCVIGITMVSLPHSSLVQFEVAILIATAIIFTVAHVFVSGLIVNDLCRHLKIQAFSISYKSKQNVNLHITDGLSSKMPNEEKITGRKQCKDQAAQPHQDVSPT